MLLAFGAALHDLIARCVLPNVERSLESVLHHTASPGIDGIQIVVGGRLVACAK